MNINIDKDSLLKVYQMYKTQFCKHEHSCLQNILIGTFKAFYKGFIVKFLLNFLMFLIKIKKQKNLKTIIQSLFNKSTFNLAVLMSIQTFLLKSIQCLLRIVRNKEDGWNAFISGLVAGGCSLSTQSGQTRYNLRVYLFGRAVDCYYQSLVKKGLLKERQINPVLIFALCSGMIGYSFFFEPYIVPYDTFKLYFKKSNPFKGDILLHYVIQETRKKRLRMIKYEGYPFFKLQNIPNKTINQREGQFNQQELYKYIILSNQI